MVSISSRHCKIRFTSVSTVSLRVSIMILRRPRARTLMLSTIILKSSTLGIRSLASLSTCPFRLLISFIDTTPFISNNTRTRPKASASRAPILISFSISVLLMFSADLFSRQDSCLPVCSAKEVRLTYRLFYLFFRTSRTFSTRVARLGQPSCIKYLPNQESDVLFGQRFQGKTLDSKRSCLFF